MDIALLATVNSSVQTNEAASLEVIKMAMNNSKECGKDTVQMLKSADPNVGNNIDVTV